MSALLASPTHICPALTTVAKVPNLVFALPSDAFLCWAAVMALPHSTRGVSVPMLTSFSYTITHTFLAFLDPQAARSWIHFNCNSGMPMQNLGWVCRWWAACHRLAWAASIWLCIKVPQGVWECIGKVAASARCKQMIGNSCLQGEKHQSWRPDTSCSTPAWSHCSRH